MGWGSFIVPCSTYLLKSGLLGTILGLLIGLAFILVIVWNLQYVICKHPSAGGIYIFEKKSSGGRDLGFLAFWFILLTYLGLLWTNVTSLPLFAGFFLGNTFKFGFRYTIFGYDVWLGEVLLSIFALIVIGFICSRSKKCASRIVIVSALVFVIGFIACELLVALKHDSSFSYSPLYIEDSNALAQILRIAVISPWAFVGFEIVAHFSEEFSFPIKKIRKILILSVVIAAFLYIAVTALSVSAYPAEYGSWLDYIRDMGNLKGLKAVPAFYAAYTYLGRPGVIVLILALFAVILTSLIGNMMALSRLISSASREGDVPRVLDSPNKAIVAVVVFSVFIPFLGRTAIGWIVDISTICATIVYCMVSHAALSTARRLGDKTEQITGFIGMIIMLVSTLLMLIPGLLPSHNIGKETYILFIAWILLGLLCFRSLHIREKKSEETGHVIIWVFPLLLVLFSSMMLVSKITESAADNAVENIYEYHQSNPYVDTEEEQIELRKQFIQEQEKRITKTNTLFSILSIGLFMIFSGVVFSSYNDYKLLGKRLSEAEKIASLKESVSAMINNMPVMSFSKDAKTGKYLACNKMFSEYAIHGEPADLIGLTDYNFVDKELADKYAQEDRLVLEMDKPLVRYGTSTDSSGNVRKIQSKKLKYHDTNGRLCILGMLVDVTEMENLKSSNAIYENIVTSLTEDYFNMFYVDLDTDNYIEYGLRTEVKRDSSERRGEGFFKTILTNARSVIYPEDQERVMAELDRDHILKTIDKNGSFEVEYRIVLGGVPTYVGLKARRVSGDGKHLIVGISNIDSQVKGREAIRQAEEDSKTYLRLSALNGNLLVLYYVDPETDSYSEFSTTQVFDELGISKHGDDFFTTSYQNSLKTIHPDDLDLIKTQFNKENILKTIERNKVFSLEYRLKLQEGYKYIMVKATEVEDSGKRLMIVGVFDIDAQVRQEQEIEHDLSEARRMASKDSLTGVRNKRAYLDEEHKLNEKIASGDVSEFALVVFDINDLKYENDTHGHQAGDELIRKASSTICNIFKHSPVFRIGGDEFAVICQGDDYYAIDDLLKKMDIANKSSVKVAYGMSRYDGKGTVADVFERADHNMYKNKVMLKEV